MKFTSEGSVDFGFEIRGGELYVYVADTGAGIPEEHREQLFQRFVKAGSFRQGIGIGLAISKSIVETMGGRIGVDSEVGKGSRFHIELRQPRAASPAEAPESATTRLEGARVLVVDDEESLCEILQFNLEVEGYEADVAYSAEQALRMHPERYSLILLDVMMGEMSGFRMAQLLKADPETARVPVIFCTAKDSEDDTVAGLNIGADDYITKPFSVREVLARVRSVLRRTSAARAESESIRFEGLEIDLRRKVCTLDGKELQLTKKEFEILALLLSNRGVIFSREEILRRIWSDEVIVLDRTVDVNIDYCGYTVPDEFLVGYGLDYAEKYRNLPDIGVLDSRVYGAAHE